MFPTISTNDTTMRREYPDAFASKTAEPQAAKEKGEWGSNGQMVSRPTNQVHERTNRQVTARQTTQTAVRFDEDDLTSEASHALTEGYTTCANPASTAKLQDDLVKIEKALKQKYPGSFATLTVRPWEDPQRWTEETERLAEVREGVRIWQQTEQQQRAQKAWQNRAMAQRERRIIEETRAQEQQRAQKRVMAQRDRWEAERAEQPQWREQCGSFGARFANALYDGMVVGPQELVRLGIGLMRGPHNEKDNNKYAPQRSTKTTTIEAHGGCGLAYERHGEGPHWEYRNAAGGRGWVGIEANTDGRAEWGSNGQMVSRPTNQVHERINRQVTARQTTQTAARFDEDDLTSEASHALTEGCDDASWRAVRGKMDWMDGQGGRMVV
ncbi:unnamed protein product [Vitrella brassicaformis CCMP3155]|uniref:Uncharacterized protein n=1 Tax=Vitrella brassicaformis (strain CCMP3155) TaxID=1169540 RepID=A0A0G4ER64_VITBC|nr:unnamed protein product [Vitrella brassicaformis CCMP3155]|eukprot:CEL99751.1 unnamed protein product [Vitrella brassicaformis CCMP3155]